MQLVVLVIGILMTVVAVFVISWYSKKELDKIIVAQKAGPGGVLATEVCVDVYDYFADRTFLIVTRARTGHFFVQQVRREGLSLDSQS